MPRGHKPRMASTRNWTGVIFIYMALSEVREIQCPNRVLGVHYENDEDTIQWTGPWRHCMMCIVSLGCLDDLRGILIVYDDIWECWFSCVRLNNVVSNMFIDCFNVICDGECFAHPLLSFRWGLQVPLARNICMANRPSRCDCSRSFHPILMKLPPRGIGLPCHM